MSAYERAVRLLAAAVPGAGPQAREELAWTALAVGRERGPAGRIAELVALVDLLLERRSARWAGGGCRATVRRGALLGAVWVLVAAALPAVAAAIGAPRPVVAATAIISGVLVPAAALLPARHVPALAVAVAVVWTVRLVLADLDDGWAALRAWSVGADEGQLLVRWCLMAVGVAAAVVVARRGLRQGSAAG